MRAPDYSGAATLVREGETVAVRATYRLKQDRIPISDTQWIPGLRSWAGSLDAPLDMELGEASLVLPDGREGRIIVIGCDRFETTCLGDTWMQSSPGVSFTFVGTGPAPGEA
jgi:hypothetical protein